MPTITLRDIDEQIRKLQELRKIVADPEMASLINQLFARKNGQSIMSIADAQDKDKAKTQKRGTFIGKIEEVVRSMPQTSTFTLNDVIEVFEASGNAFNAKNKSVATYTAMRRLEKRKVIEVVERGIGSKPSTFRVVR